MNGKCDKCKKKKKIVTHRMGVPWCATCNMQEIRDRGPASEDEHGKPMTFASGGLSQIEKWAGSTSSTHVKRELKPVLKRLKALMVVELGGATPDEFAQVADLVRDDNPFAAVIDPGQEPLDVEFDSQDEPADEDDTIQGKGESATEDGKSTPASEIASAGDQYAAERRDAVSPAIDTEVSSLRSTPEVAAKVVSPPPEQIEPTIGLPPNLRKALFAKGFKNREIDTVRLPHGLDTKMQLREALRQLGKLPKTSAAAKLVGVSDEVRQHLLVDQEFTPAEVNSVRVAPGLDRDAQLREALKQLK